MSNADPPTDVINLYIPTTAALSGSGFRHNVKCLTNPIIPLRARRTTCASPVNNSIYLETRVLRDNGHRGRANHPVLTTRLPLVPRGSPANRAEDSRP